MYTMALKEDPSQMAIVCNRAQAHLKVSDFAAAKVPPSPLVPFRYDRLYPPMRACDILNPRVCLRMGYRVIARSYFKRNQRIGRLFSATPRPLADSVTMPRPSTYVGNLLVWFPKEFFRIHSLVPTSPDRPSCVLD